MTRGYAKRRVEELEESLDRMLCECLEALRFKALEGCRQCEARKVIDYYVGDSYNISEEIKRV